MNAGPFRISTTSVLGDVLTYSKGPLKYYNSQYSIVKHFIYVIKRTKQNND